MESKPAKASKRTPTTTYNVRVKPPVTVIHNCYTGVVFTSDPVELEAVDSWTQSQIDAGKLELC